jgi:phosphate transport system protein
VNDLQFEAEMAVDLLRKALDAFARLDPLGALEVIKQDRQIDNEFEGLLRKLITYMMEDPRTISACIDLVFVAKAVERIGDHAKNLAEAVIYVVKGTDVRHSPMTDVESAVG